jgi:hypothetical protein
MSEFPPAFEQIRRTTVQTRNVVDHLMAYPFNFEIVLLDEDGGPIGDVGPFVIRLLQANGGWLEPNELRASNFLGSGRGETRAVGTDIHAVYGFGGMLAVHEIIASMLPDGAARELEAAWSRIGEWQS